MVLPKRRLQWRQIIAFCEALDGLHVLAVRLDREHQAASHGLSINDYGACAAYSMLTAHMRAGQT